MIAACGRQRIALALVTLSCVACKTPPATTTLDALLVDGVEQGLPGVILLVDRPGTDRDFLDARGFADRDAGIALTSAARFRVASNSKAFVALALAQLDVDGVLELDDPVSRWLDPAVTKDIENAERVSVRQLLDHTSGIYDYLDDAFEAAVEADPGHAWTIDEALAYARGEPAYFDPGQGWEYSNTNYLLAGKVIEAATGDSWGAVVHARVLEPLGLSASFVEGSGVPTGPIVHGYGEEERDMIAINTGYGLPDGGLVSTAQDLATFVRAVATRAPPLAAASALATTDLVAADDGHYGLGFSHWTDLNGVEAWGHGGNIEGYQSEMFYFPSHDVSLVLLVNGSEGDLDALFSDLLDRAIALALR